MLAGPATSHAAFPGPNGQIVYSKTAGSGGDGDDTPFLRQGLFVP